MCIIMYDDFMAGADCFKRAPYSARGTRTGRNKRYAGQIVNSK